MTARPKTGVWQRSDGAVWSVDAAFARASRLVATLPDRPLLNLCIDRLDFVTVLLASAMRRQPCLLPSADSASALEAVRAGYPDAIEIRSVDDTRTPVSDAGWRAVLDYAGTATVAYTSGSTGTPKPVAKTWPTLLGDAACLVAALARHGVSDDTGVVATVPPQHMYGLETTVLTALAAPYVVYAGRPFFPADIAAALASLPGPRMLVSTPVHLKALLNSDIAVPAVDVVVSAAAPLPTALAERLQIRLACRVVEIYGSTETGAIASREPTEDETWNLFPGVRFDASHARLQCDHLPAGTAIQDRLEVLSSERFRLLGRPDDMIKVGGKRFSKQALTEALLSVDGVEDAAVTILDAADRVAAVVVAPGVDAAAIRSALALRVDPVFIPRPLRHVSAIPKTPTGKPAAAALRELLAGAS